MAERYYVDCPLAAGPVEVHGPEAHHLANVCRVRVGEVVCLFNGDGHEYPAEVSAVSRKQVLIQVLAVKTPQRELDCPVQVAAPLPRGDRAQFLVEKLTELGVTSFVPLQTQRSVVHPGEGRREKLQRYVIEASKQCGRNVLLRIEPPSDWETYCARKDLPVGRFVAHPGGMKLPSASGQDMAMAVGPEGGFTEEEIALAQTCGWQVINLGARILRVETAALVLAAWAGLGG